MWKELRKLALAIGAVVCAALAICENEKPKPPDEGVRPIVLISPYNAFESQAFDDSLDIVGGFIRRGGDTMNGPLLSASLKIYPFGIKDTGYHGICVRGVSANATTCSGASFEADGTAVYIQNNGVGLMACNIGSGVCTFSSGTSSVAFIASGNAQAVFQATGTGWIESAGDTSANVQSRTPAAGTGAFLYDDTNLRWRLYENTGASASWNAIPSFNPDGGAPFGTAYTWSATKATAATTANLLIGYTSFQLPIRGEVITFIPQVAGAGAGNVTMAIKDNGGTDICTGTFACNTAVGTARSVACNFKIPAGNTQFFFDASACTAATSPIGTATLTYHPQL